jgi:hypothetical protein
MLEKGERERRCKQINKETKLEEDRIFAFNLLAYVM